MIESRSWGTILFGTKKNRKWGYRSDEHGIPNYGQGNTAVPSSLALAAAGGQTIITMDWEEPCISEAVSMIY